MRPNRARTRTGIPTRPCTARTRPSRCRPRRASRPAARCRCRPPPRHPNPPGRMARRKRRSRPRRLRSPAAPRPPTRSASSLPRAVAVRVAPIPSCILCRPAPSARPRTRRRSVPSCPSWASNPRSPSASSPAGRSTGCASAPSTARTTRTGRKKSWTRVASTLRWCGSSGSAAAPAGATIAAAPASDPLEGETGMKRREFSATVAGVLGASALMAPPSVLAQGRPQEGKDFRAIEKKVPVEAPPGKIEVVEFFWYSCPHCNAFEPRLNAWLKKLPPDVSFRRVPVAFRDDFVPQQRLYYTLEAMGKVDELHRKVFNAIHVEKQPTAKEDQILAWAEKNGLDKAKFKEVYNSFSVQAKTRKASQLQEAFQVEGVPALGIAGRWYTDGSMAGNMPRALQVTDYLVAEARKSR